MRSEKEMIDYDDNIQSHIKLAKEVQHEDL